MVYLCYSVDTHTNFGFVSTVFSHVSTDQSILVLCRICSSRHCFFEWVECGIGQNNPIRFPAFFVGYTGYLTEFSTRETIERNTSLSWLFVFYQPTCNKFWNTFRGVSSFGYLSSAIINLGVIIISQSKESGTVSNYREYSNTEIRSEPFRILSVGEQHLENTTSQFRNFRKWREHPKTLLII